VRRLLLATLVVTVASGCSWSFQETLAADPKPEAAPRCSAAPTWPIVDGVFAAGLATAGVVNIRRAPDSKKFASLIIGLPALVAAAAHVYSGLDGAGAIRDCLRARRRHERFEKARPPPR
jgi:hypothetical protein